MQTLGSVAAVAAAAREDADAEAERVAQAASAEVAALASGDPPPLDAGERQARVAAAQREARERLAREDALDAQAALEAREAWLRDVVAEARRRLPGFETADARRQRLDELARAALARLPGGDGRVIESDDGVRVVSSDGRFTIDESLDARARRFEPAWRATLGRMWG